MAKQLHKRFTTQEVKMFLKQYLDNRKKLPYLLEILHITKRRFFHLLQQYQENPDEFCIEYQRKKPTRKIPAKVEKNILKELKIAKSLIEDKQLPINHYNYSYIQDQLEKKHKQKVSLPTIIKRAKDNGFYKQKKRKKKSHDREVQTQYSGQLIQHDSSHHKFSPYAKKKWYLITSLDDYSRFILFYQLVEKETTWEHIKALQEVVLTQGVPFCYYVDSHSLFRNFVLPSPYRSTKDIFCLRVKRKVDAYHKISISNLKLRVHEAPLRGEVEIRIYPDEKEGIAELRIWHKGILCDIY